MSGTPAASLRIPNEKRMHPLTESIPIIDTKIPNIAPIIPFATFPFDTLAMIERPKIAMQKYSGGPNNLVIFAILGAANSNTNALNVPPTNDAYNAIVNAFSGLPFFVIGYPSRSVAAFAGVPGVLIRIAVIEPPYVPPQYNPRHRRIAGIGSNVYVSGRQRIIARQHVVPWNSHRPHLQRKTQRQCKHRLKMGQRQNHHHREHRQVSQWFQQRVMVAL